MTEQPDQSNQTPGEQRPIDADLGNYDESGHAVAAPGQTDDQISDSPIDNDQETGAGDVG